MSRGLGDVYKRQSPDNVKGLFTIDRCKESAQWAEYEIEMAVVTASLINILAETECDDN